MKKVLFILMSTIVLCSCGSSGSKSQSQPQEESKNLSATSLVLQGKHAKLFQSAEDSYQVKLVQTDEGWEVRAKVIMKRKNAYEQLDNYAKYEKELSSLDGKFLNDNDVEIADCSVDREPLNMLLQDHELEQATLKPQTWSYKHLSYEDAKAIYDKVAYLELTDIELEESDYSDVSGDIFDDDTKETLETATELLKAEGELLNTLFK